MNSLKINKNSDEKYKSKESFNEPKAKYLNNKNNDNKIKIKVNIDNIVASTQIANYINTKFLIEKFTDIEDRKNFPGIIINLIKPNVSVLLFSSGKMVITGIKKEELIKDVIKIINTRLKLLGFKVFSECKYVIHNYVYTIDFFKKINLELLSIMLNNSIYDPETFPGIIHKTYTDNEKNTFLIFSSGKILCTGIKKKDAISNKIVELYKFIRENDCFIEKNE
ncbi:MAG: hypothetical protein ACTSU2_09640 [Promethearchaeota archaeon]